MAFTINTTAGTATLKENWDAFEKGIDVKSGPYVKCQYLLEDWSKSDAVVNALMGSLHRCPVSPNLYCLNAKCTGAAEVDARDAGHPRFKWAVIDATYGLRPWEEDSDEDPDGDQSFPHPGETESTQPFLFMEQSVDFDTEVVKLPNTSYKFSSSPQLPLNVPVGRTVAVAQFTLVRKYQTVLPLANIRLYLNKLNDSTFLGQNRGEIKFRKARTRRTYMSDGTKTQDVEYVFQWREFDHNKVHRPDSTSWDFIVDDAGNKTYAYSNLAVLLA